MKKFVILAVAVLLCMGMVASVDAQPTIRVGGSLIFDGTQWGGAAAVDIPVSEDMPIAISPFVEFYKKSGVTTIPLGANILYTARPMGDEGGTIYFGGGGGAIRVSNGVSSTKYLIDGVGGATVPVGESLNLYGEVKWLYSNDLDINDVSASVGIAFSLGQ